MWFVRCVLWATPLAVVCYWISPAYHRALVSTALGALGLPVHPRALASVDLSAANVLGMFAAMCLASRRAPAGRRAVSLVAGLAALVLIEWGSGVVGLRTAMLEAAQGGWSPAVERTRHEALELVRWISVPALWLVLLGKWELPGGWPGRPVRGRAGRSKPAVGAGKRPP